jgi:hypothetical protein
MSWAELLDSQFFLLGGELVGLFVISGETGSFSDVILFQVTIQLVEVITALALSG